MKKLIIPLLILVLLFTFFQPTSASAAEADMITEIEYFENGDYIETTITIYPQARSSENTTTGKKTLTYKNSSGDALWSISVTATFTYVSGKSCTCTSVSGSAATYSSSWKVSDVTTSKSGNSASSTATGTHYFSIIPLNSVTQTITLTCDNYGNLS